MPRATKALILSFSVPYGFLRLFWPLSSLPQIGPIQAESADNPSSRLHTLHMGPSGLS